MDNVGAEMAVSPAEAEKYKCGRAGPAQSTMIENNSEDVMWAGYARPVNND